MSSNNEFTTACRFLSKPAFFNQTFSLIFQPQPPRPRGCARHTSTLPPHAIL
jgi:hypothetical protein